MIRELYQSKEKRDQRYKELKAQGIICKRSSTGVSLIHPQYITDFKGDEKFQTGLGNTVYKTYFKNLYRLESI